MTAPALTPWLAFCRPDSRAKLRLFCFPYAGGSASVYIKWKEVFAKSGVEVCPVQPPSRQTGRLQPPVSSMDEVADQAFKALSPFFDISYAFFGHSLGGTVAYEVAQRAKAANKPQPRILVTSATRAPNLPLRHEPMHLLPDDAFCSRLAALNGTPAEILANSELLSVILPIVRQDFRLDETYRHRSDYPLLDCPILACGGTADKEVPEEDVQAWRAMTRGEFTLKLFPSDHFFIHSHGPELMATVAEALQAHC